MKAKYLKKLRYKVKYYDVVESYGFFGSFSPQSDRTTVLATSYYNAVKRYLKRNNIFDEFYNAETTYSWAKYKVTLKDLPFKRHTKYFK